MNLFEYQDQYVRVTDKWGNIFEGIASEFPAGYGLHEFDRDEESVNVAGCQILESDIASIERVAPHGSAEIATENLFLRKYRPEDAEDLYETFGRDPAMYRYSGWNPYATPEMAEESVKQFIENYSDPHFYGWAIEWDGYLVGTIGAYDYKDDSVEIGFSIARGYWGKGYATEALSAVLDHLMNNDDIKCVTAWCASENIASRKTLEKSGMKLIREETGGLTVGEQTYDKLFFEIRKPD